jgi:hypothetical protein
MGKEKYKQKTKELSQCLKSQILNFNNKIIKMFMKS